MLRTAAGAGALLMLVALLGLCGGPRLLGWYSALAACAALAGAGAACVLGLTFAGHFDGELADAWDTAVRRDAAGVCGTMRALHCNGWGAPCGAGDEPPADDAVSDAHGCPMCPDAVNATRTCDDVVRDAIRRLFPAYLTADVALTAACIVCVGCALRIRAQEKEEGRTSTLYISSSRIA